MAKPKQATKTVTLTSPRGTRVTVSEGAAKKYTDLGYKGEKAPAPKKPAEKPVEKKKQ